MPGIEVGKLSNKYAVRRLNADDIGIIHALCAANTQYHEYCGREISVKLIENDMKITPPGIPMEQKYYIGFFENSSLVAIMDLIDGYPDAGCAFIGFFMINRELQGRGIGSGIISEAFDYLKALGFSKCRLGIDKENPQSNHFWKKNGFEVIREVPQEEGIILLAERQL